MIAGLLTHPGPTVQLPSEPGRAQIFLKIPEIGKKQLFGAGF